MAEHGSATRYEAGCRCTECRAGHAAKQRRFARRRALKVELGSPDVPHGTIAGYRSWSCRCDPCRAANARDYVERVGPRRRELRALRAGASAAELAAARAGARDPVPCDHMGRRNLPAAHEPGVLEGLAAVYVRGTSIRELASIKGWSYGAVHRRLVAAQKQGLMTIRSRGGVSSANARGTK